MARKKVEPKKAEQQPEPYIQEGGVEAHIIADMGEKGLISVKGVQKLQEILDGSFTGSDFFRVLTDENVGVMHKHGDSVNSFEAKTRLNEYLEDAGYEGTVHSNKNSETVIVNYNSETPFKSVVNTSLI